MPYDRQFDGLGRNELERVAADALRRGDEAIKRANDAEARIADLLREGGGSAFLPKLGWDCPNPECGVFVGDLKERRTTCRTCGTPRPT